MLPGRHARRNLGGSTIGVTHEEDADGAFLQEKTDLTESGWGAAIVEPL